MSWSPPYEAPPPVSPDPERTLWRMAKDDRTAEARLRSMAHGSELRITVGSEVLMTRLYRHGELEEMAGMSEGIRQTFVWKGWELQPADEPAGERN